MMRIFPASELKRVPVSHLKVIAAIPCYNTQKYIADIVSRARRYVDEVIVVDDGSTDDTYVLALSAGALAIRHESNRGYGEAIKSCFVAAKKYNADILVILDGDGQHNPDEIPKLVQPLVDKQADIVIGSRFLKVDSNIPAFRKFGIRCINLIWNFGAKTRITDTQSGFRAYSKKFLKNISLSESGMGVSIEIIEKARRSKMLFHEVPISCLYEVENKKISFKAIKQGIAVALASLKIRIQPLFDSVNIYNTQRQEPDETKNTPI